MNVAARLRYARISPQKCRLVADMVRGKPVGEALQTLQFTPKKAAGIVKKVLESAIANAENLNDAVDVDELFVKEIFVDGGPALKRVWFTTMGRAYRKLKRQSHVTIKLDTHREED